MLLPLIKDLMISITQVQESIKIKILRKDLLKYTIKIQESHNVFVKKIITYRW